MKTGKIIYLNGTSSSGKTTIAKELQNQLLDPFMYLSLDSFFYFYPKKYWDAENDEDHNVFLKIAPMLIRGFRETIYTLANSGNNLIVDDVLESSEQQEMILSLMQNMNVFWIGIKCPLDILKEREKIRGDRMFGLAEYQFDKVHTLMKYDIELDTSKLSVNESVDRITGLLQ